MGRTIGPLYAPNWRGRPEGKAAKKPPGVSAGRLFQSEAKGEPVAPARLIGGYLRLAERFERVERPFERVLVVRRVRDAVRPRFAVERAVLFRRVVLRDGLRRFVAVLRRLVAERRAVDLRAVDLRPDDRRVVLREEVLRPVLLRPVLLRPVLLRDVLREDFDLRPDVLRREDPVLPERSRRLVRA
jgi:hypothetical protein